jgi:type I restriction enzyme S subunit
VTWFGNVPAHWSTPPVYARYEVKLGKMLDDRQITKRYLAPYLRNTDVQWGGINVEDLPEMDFDDSEQKLYGLRHGDILVCEGGEIGRCAIWDSDRRCFYQKALHRLRPTTERDDPRFFVLAMRAAVDAGLFSSRASAATIQHLPAEKLRIVRYPAPPIEEQRAIVDHVSKETTRLDALVASKQRVLDLLAEKRKAIISTAVTRGLDPKTKLRDSGIPWLGEVPAHWDVTRLKFHLNGITQGWSPQCEALPAGPEEWGVLKAGCVNGNTFNEHENKRLPDSETALPEIEVRPRDVVMSRANTTELVGSAAIAPADVRPRLLLSDKLYRLNVKVGDLLPELVVYFLRTSPGRFEFERTASGASNSMQNISQDAVRNVWLPVPPLSEQHAILEHIARETMKLDAVRAATERTIALLKERRSALIAAAVTGQIELEAAK